MTREPLSDKEIFNVARQLESKQAVETYLDHVCGGDPAKRARILDLLGADQRDGFLEQSPAALLEIVRTANPVEQEGQAIGEYKLLQRIDGGGMDVVFIVEQTQPISRRVVLKIIKPGMDTEQPGTDEVP